MMGLKARQFGSLEGVTLEELVPRQHFYRQLERALDLSFVRELVRPCYAAGGRPSVDPVVFFKLMLIMFFEGIRSERQLMRVVADRLSARWYCGYDLHESVNLIGSHADLYSNNVTGWRSTGGFFDLTSAAVPSGWSGMGCWFCPDAPRRPAGQCRAGCPSTTPPFRACAARHHADIQVTQDAEAEGPIPPYTVSTAEPPDAISPAESEQGAALQAANAARHDWLAKSGRQDRDRIDPRYLRTSDRLVSTTDPDATYLKQRDGVRVGYQDHYVVDGGKARIILSVLVAPAEVMEDRPALDLLWHTRFRWQLRPRQATGDKAYGTLEVIRGLEEQHIHAYMSLPDFDSRSSLFGKQEFRYDPGADVYICPDGVALRFDRLDKGHRLRLYRAEATTCNVCPLKAKCTTVNRGRSVSRNYDEEYIDRVRAYQETDAFQKARRKRSVWVEPLFAEAKDWHGLRRFRLRRLWRVNCEALRIAAGQNLKRLLSRRGWGQRSFPGGAPGVRIGAHPASAAAC